MRDHELGLRRDLLPPIPIAQINNESSRGTVDVKKVHRIRADAGELWSLVFTRVPAFCSCNDFPNRAAAQTASPKRKRLIETIVQLWPFTAISQLVDGLEIEIRRCPGQKAANIFCRRFHQLPVGK